MEKENWIKWLQARIPTLKESHNELWLGMALDGYLESKQNQALSMSGVVGRSEQLCDLDGKTVRVKFKATKHIPKIVIEDI
jgi:hypothetical protein